MPGLNSSTKLLLHCDGSNGSTTFTDATARHTMTAYDSAQVDTSNAKWGTGALHIVSDDYLTAPESTDFNFLNSTSGAFSVDFWIKLGAVTDTRTWMMYGASPGLEWRIQHSDGNGLRFSSDAGDTSHAGEINDTTTYYHIAVIRVADKIGLYKAGTQIGYVQMSGTINITGNNLYIGKANSTSPQWTNAYMDEIRFQNGNYFNAAPVSGLTDTITVPSAAYTRNVPFFGSNF